MKDGSPIVEEVRERAREISRRYGDDLRRYAEHLKEIEQRRPQDVADQVTVVRTPSGSAAPAQNPKR